jgi:hypothetical protein
MLGMLPEQQDRATLRAFHAIGGKGPPEEAETIPSAAGAFRLGGARCRFTSVPVRSPLRDFPVDVPLQRLQDIINHWLNLRSLASQIP